MIKKYKPSNSAGGEQFKRKFCMKCEWWKLMETTDQPYRGCPIELATTRYDKSDDKYPHQWRYNEDKEPICTEFREVN